jgi:hypothetical protein
MRHQLIRDLFRKQRIEATTNINRRQFPVLALVVYPQFGALEIEVSFLGISL